MAPALSHLPETESPPQTDTPMTDANGYLSSRLPGERSDQNMMVRIILVLLSSCEYCFSVALLNIRLQDCR
jgi:hypothetical protein